MKKSTFYQSGNWYRGNLHAHTTRSDGRKTPEELIECYKKLNYDFLAITDHRRYGIFPEYCDDKFLLLPGVELDCDLGGRPGCHHIVGIGTPENKFAHEQRFESLKYTGSETPQKMIDMLRENGNLVIYAHPRWSLVSPEDMLPLTGYDMLEIINYGCCLEDNTAFSELHYDIMLWNKRKSWCIGVDDTHQKLYDYGGGWVCVKAKELTHAGIINALRDGSFYASGGPSIYDFYVEDGVAYAECSPCASIAVTAWPNRGKTSYHEDRVITHAKWKITGDVEYVRLECIDHGGRKAWSQPIYL